MKENGVTLVEVLVVSVIMVIILTGALTVYLMSETAWRESTARARLQRNASIIMEKMIRGAEGVYGIRNSKAINTPNVTPPAVDYEVVFTGIDNKNRKFYRSGSGSGDEIIYYDPDESPTTSTFAEDINSLTFERLTTERLRIGLSMFQTVKDKDISISLSTDVTIRN